MSEKRTAAAVLEILSDRLRLVEHEVGQIVSILRRLSELQPEPPPREGG